MMSPVDTHLSRRDVLHGGLVMSAAAVLSGCQATPHRPTAALPGPIWPDKRLPSTPVPVPSHAASTTEIIPRSAWTNAQPKMSKSLPMNGVQRITIHHDAINSSGLVRQADVARRLESIRRAHLARGSEWVDIGYHYIIDPEGRIWQGRPISIEGAHVAKTNPHNLGVMLMGNFDEHRPSQQALATLDAFVTDQMRRFRVPINRVYTHKELRETACPGVHLQRYMVATRSGSGRMAHG